MVHWNENDVIPERNRKIKFYYNYYTQDPAEGKFVIKKDGSMEVIATIFVFEWNSVIKWRYSL